MTFSRHQQREIVFQVLFTWEFRESDFNIDQLSDRLEKHIHSFQKEEKEVLDTPFIRNLLLGVINKSKEIKAIIQTYAPEWPLEKINPVDRSILYLGIYEILFTADVPDIVAINEAIELAKKYGNENSGKFINGVMNTVMTNKESILSA